MQATEQAQAFGHRLSRTTSLYIGNEEKMGNGISRVTGIPVKRVIGKAELNDFVLLSNRRDIRGGVVNKLARLLKSGGHFESPFVTNRINDHKERLIDGNHRYEAIKQVIDENPNFKVEVIIVYYEDLNPQEERQLYTTWNSGTKQNTNDFVKQYWTTIPIVKLMNREGFAYPVRHIWSKKAIEFKTLVGGYLTKNDATFIGGYQGSAFDFIIESQSLGANDCKVIDAFLKEYIAVFGNPDKKSIHYRQAVFYSLFRIWLENKGSKNPALIATALRRVRNHPVVVRYANLGGTRENCVTCARELLEIINGQKVYNRFVLNVRQPTLPQAEAA
jgi:hypothetical protein